MSQKRFLIIKGSNGMGNRLLALAKGLVYAKITNRQIVVDWRDGMYADRGINAFHNLFTNPIINPNPDIPVTDSIFPKEWIGNLEKNINEIIHRDFNLLWFLTNKIRNKTSRYTIDLSIIDYKEDILVMLFDSHFNFNQLKGHIYMLPEEWPKDGDNLLRYVFKNFIFLKPDIVRMMDDFKKKYFKNKVIGVHIRYTDNFDIIKKTKIEEYFEAVDGILKNEPEATIFIATDSEEILKKFNAKYKNVVSTEKSYPPKAGKPMHYYTGCKDKTELARLAVIDMRLLSLCDYLVTTDMSSFSLIPRLISDIEKDKIFTIGIPQSVWHIFIYNIKDIYIHFLGIVGGIIKKRFTGLYYMLKKYFPDY